MRSTRATAAIGRLNARSGELDYSFVLGADRTFQLIQTDATSTAQKIGEPLPLDEFVAYVNAYGPQIPRRMTKNDIAFEKQLIKKVT